MDFLKDIIKEVGGEYTKIASDIVEEERFIDTGSLIFNALLSGSLYDGVSENKITALAGKQSTGKTYFALAIVKHFLDQNPGSCCIYFDTESAVTKSLLSSRGIELDRVLVINVVTIEEFRIKSLKLLSHYLKKPEDERPKMLMVLDSLGMLSSNKEIEDTLGEKNTKDMTKAALIKGAFRMLTLKLGVANVPMIVTNHTYETMSLYSTEEMSGGSGLKYAASTIIYLSKKKEKEGTEIIGNIIKAKTNKSRFSKENQEVEVRLFYDDRGLDRYYGLLELGEMGGLWQNKAGRYEIDGKKVFGKEILRNPQDYFTEEIMEKLNNLAKLYYSYGQ